MTGYKLSLRDVYRTTPVQRQTHKRQYQVYQAEVHRQKELEAEAERQGLEYQKYLATQTAEAQKQTKAIHEQTREIHSYNLYLERLLIVQAEKQKAEAKDITTSTPKPRIEFKKSTKSRVYRYTPTRTPTAYERLTKRSIAVSKTKPSTSKVTKTTTRTTPITGFASLSRVSPSIRKTRREVRKGQRLKKRAARKMKRSIRKSKRKSKRR